MLIRLLCDPKYLTESSCTATSSVIIDALSRKKDSKVQSEVRLIILLQGCSCKKLGGTVVASVCVSGGGRGILWTTCMLSVRGV